MNRLELKKVTLVAVSSIKIEETILALKKSMKEIDFYEVVLISHQKPENLPPEITFKQCEKIDSLNKYNKFILFDLYKYLDSEFALVVQYDGYILNPNKWTDDFLKYDYIGAPWRKNNYFTKDRENIRVGNGGFSLRSKKLLVVFNDLKISFKNADISTYHEDEVICIYCRKELESYGITYAPVPTASLFSCEQKLADSLPETFGFHIFKKKSFDDLRNLTKFILNKLHLNFFRHSYEVIIDKK
jgi:hypothetical protein